MENQQFIKVLKRKERSFVHLPIEIPTVLIIDPDNEKEKIFLPEAFHHNFKNFILEKDPDAYSFIKRGIDERHQANGIRKYLIFSESVKNEFDEFIINFCDKYKVSFDFD
jgi:hypothetical protein